MQLLRASNEEADVRVRLVHIFDLADRPADVLIWR